MGEKRSRFGAFKQSMRRQWRFIGLLALTGALMLVGVFSASLNQHGTYAAGSPGDWSTYMDGVGRQGFNPAETIINATSAPNLKLHWSYKAGGNIFSQPVVVNGDVYWGSYDGYEHATDLNGNLLWQQYVGLRTTCSPLPKLGVVSTAAVTTVPINGTPTSVVFVGGGR